MRFAVVALFSALALVAGCKLDRSDIDRQAAESRFSVLRQAAHDGDVELAKNSASSLKKILVEKAVNGLTSPEEIEGFVREAHYVRAEAGADSLTMKLVKDGNHAREILSRVAQDYTASGRPNMRFTQLQGERLVGEVYFAQAQATTHNGFKLEKHPKGERVVQAGKPAKSSRRRAKKLVALRR